MRILLICLALLAATPASALSCLRPDAVRLFEKARKAEEAYYVVKGRISLLEPAKLPEPGTEVPSETRARIEGLGLTPSGFDQVFDREVILETICHASWCASPEGLEDEFIMAVKTEDDRLTLRIGPCGGDKVLWDERSEDRVLACYRDGDCKQEF